MDGEEKNEFCVQVPRKRKHCISKDQERYIKKESNADCRTYKFDYQSLFKLTLPSSKLNNSKLTLNILEKVYVNKCVLVRKLASVYVHCAVCTCTRTL
jgi:hypothetical protein